MPPSHYFGDGGASFINPKNEESHDQVIGMFVGFAFVKKYVDNVTVCPRPGTDTPRNLVTQVEDITERILNYARSNKSFYNTTWVLICNTEDRTLTYNWEVTNPVTGLAVASDGGHLQAFAYPFECARKFITGNFSHPNLHFDALYTYSSALCPDKTASVNLSYPVSFWNDIQYLNFNNVGLALGPLELCNTINIPGIGDVGECWNVRYSIEVPDYNINMILSLAATSDASQSNWSHYNISRISNDVDMQIFDLVYATLHDVTPQLTKSMYEQILSSAPAEGPYWYDGTDNSPGWIENSRWAHPHKTPSDIGGKCGNDYMWLYNLYRIAYGNYNDVSSVAYDKDAACAIESAPAITKHLLAGTNQTNTNISVIRKFPDYVDFGISLEDYLIQDLSNNYTMTLKSNLIVCNNSTVEQFAPGSLVIGEPSGDLKQAGQLIIKSGSTLILHGGSILTVYENSKVIIEPGANFIVSPSARIELIGEHSLIDAQNINTNIDLLPGNTFVVTDNGNPGKGGMMKLAGGNFNLPTYSHLHITDCRVMLAEDVQFVYEHDAEIKLEGENSVLDIKDDWTVWNINANEKMVVTNGGTSAKGGTLNVRQGNVILFTNGKLENTNCTINLLSGTYFYYNPDAVIQLDYEDACLNFGGELHLENGCDFTFIHPNSTTGGFIKFSNSGWPYVQVITGNNCTFTLQGNDKTDKIVEIGYGAWVNLNDNLEKLTLADGRVEFDVYASWSINSDYELNNLDVYAIATTANGFLFGGPTNHIIESVDFTNFRRAVRYYAAWNGGNPKIITLNNCNFNACTEAFMATGGGFRISNTNFNDGVAVINGIGIEYPSIIDNVNISNPGTSMGIAFDGSGGGTLLVRNSYIACTTLPYLEMGVYASGITLVTLKCNEIRAWGGAANATQNSSVSISPDVSGGGMNDLSGTGAALFADNAKVFYMENGNNNLISDNTWNFLAITGTITDCLPIINASHNTWNANGTAPTRNDEYNLNAQASCGNIPPHGLVINDPTPTAVVNCAVPPIIYDRLSPLGVCEECPLLNSEHFDGVPLNEAVLAAMDTASQGDSIKDDITAIEMLYEILTTTIAYDNEKINWLGSLAYTKIKEALGNAIQYGRIAAINSSDEHVDRVIDITKQFVLRAREVDDDNAEFYYSLDLATTYRLVNERDAAISTLNNLSNCLELTESQIDYLNKWINLINAEQLVIAGDLDVMEFDDYVGGGNRVFQHFTNTQANIDTVLTYSTAQVVPSAVSSVTDAGGNTFAVFSATDTTSLNYHITKTNAASTLEWEQVYDGRQQATDSIKSIIMDANSFIYVTGKSWNGIDYDIATVKYDTAGNRYWTAIYNDLSIGNDEPLSVVIDTAFKVTVYAVSHNDTLTVYKTIVYSQCDTNCFASRQIKPGDNAKGKEKDEFGIKVFPIPAQDKLNVVISSSDPAEQFHLKLYDITGKTVKDKNISHKYLMDLNGLPAGVYQLVISNSRSAVKKQRIVVE